MSSAEDWGQRWALFAARTFRRPRPNRFRSHIRAGGAGLVALIEALQHASMAARLDALEAIAVLHDRGFATPRSIEALLCAAAGRTELTEELRRVVFAIGRANVPGLNAGFMAQLAHRDERRAAGAAYGLAGARYRRAVAPLMHLASSGRPLASPAAVWALGQIGDEAAMPTLHRLLHRGDNTPGVAAALAELGSFRSVDPLSRWVQHPSLVLRFTVGTATIRCAYGRPEGVLIPLPTVHRFRTALHVEPDPRASILWLTSLALCGVPVDGTVAARAFERWSINDRLRVPAAAPPPPAHPPPEGPHVRE